MYETIAYYILVITKMQYCFKLCWSFLFLLFFEMTRPVQSGDVTLLDGNNDDLDCTNGTKLTGYVCLPNDYHKEISPKVENEHIVRINSSMYLRNIREINSIDKSMTVDITLSLYWVDTRIRKKFTKYNMNVLAGGKAGTMVLPIKKIDYIWIPDLYIFDMAYFESYKVNSPTDSISILYNYYWSVSNYNQEYTMNNTVLQYVLDARIKIYCFKFSFERFPLEENTCTFVLGTAITKANFAWTVDNDDWRYDSVDRNEVVNGYKINSIHWINKLPKHVNQYYAGTGRAIGFEVSMTRQFMPYLIQYYIPCIAIVFLTQISFIIPLTAIPGRIALLVTEFLTLTNIFIHQQVLPKIKYNFNINTI